MGHRRDSTGNGVGSAAGLPQTSRPTIAPRVSRLLFRLFKPVSRRLHQFLDGHRRWLADGLDMARPRSKTKLAQWRISHRKRCNLVGYPCAGMAADGGDYFRPRSWTAKADCPKCRSRNRADPADRSHSIDNASLLDGDIGMQRTQRRL